MILYSTGKNSERDEDRAADRKRRRESATKAECNEIKAYSNDSFAHIVGYTPGGAPCGVIWEELGEESTWLMEKDVFCPTQ